MGSLRSVLRITRLTSLIFSSLSLAPPPSMSLRHSDLLFANPSFRYKSRMPTPSAASWGDSSILGRSSSEPPFPANRAAAVWWMDSSTWAPCSIRVASSASTFLTSLSAAPSSLAISLMSTSGNSVKSLRKRMTSRSLVLRQNCQYSNGDNMSAFNQMAPPSDLPIFLPSDVVMRGAVMAKTWAWSARRQSSTPFTMLPH
mmetsp:Transcript_51612/g.75486  ORF Transcript_51612/g.75486 Transcript_51612/m.75486 type:complete len:200 (-) Transcript_51612:397-996(-)